MDIQYFYFNIWGTTPLVASWLVHITGNNLAPAFYLMFVSIIGLIVLLTLFKDTSKNH